MQLLPRDTFTIQSHKSLPEVIRQLKAHIEAPKVIRWNFSDNHAPYEGTISSSGFEIRRIINYRNSFLPNIRGRFDSSSAGTQIRITMGLHPFVIAFLLFWYSVWYSVSIPHFLFGAFSGDLDTWLALPFVVMPIVLLFLFWCWFWYEAHRSRQELEQIILGEVLWESALVNLARSRTLKMLAIITIVIWNAVFLYFLVG
ncbi:MAG: hypothetical protein F6K41_02285 [Symploca sp. SIO3E6]|nr:hypothetical protein [Caldora sp. SIO3E6]